MQDFAKKEYLLEPQPLKKPFAFRLGQITVWIVMTLIVIFLGYLALKGDKEGTVQRCKQWRANYQKYYSEGYVVAIPTDEIDLCSAINISLKSH